MNDTFDVVIVGGGAAGLSAALVLGRCRRSVLVCDSGQPRNRASRAVHCLLGRVGVAPSELLRSGHLEIKGYSTVTLLAECVTAITPSGNQFVISCGGECTLVGLLVRHWVVNNEILNSEQVTRAELLEALRREGCSSLNKVRFAFLETDESITLGAASRTTRARATESLGTSC